MTLATTVFASPVAAVLVNPATGLTHGDGLEVSTVPLGSPTPVVLIDPDTGEPYLIG